MAPTAHARLAPSASKIWMACPGAPALAEGCPDESSEHAERGTLAHHVLELCLLHGFNAADFRFNATRQTPTFEDDEAVQKCIDFCRSECEDGDEIGIEEKLVYNDDLWGTSDFSRYRPSTQELLVVDYKNGSGVAVDAENNPQGVCYALMKLKALANRGVNLVRFVIVQPRGFHELGDIREFEIAGIDMLEWEDEIIAAIKQCAKAEEILGALTKRDGAAFEKWWKEYTASGDHCRWCKARAVCPRLRQEAEDAMQVDFAPIVAEAKRESRGLESVAGVDLERLAQDLERAGRVKAWAQAVDELAYFVAEAGGKVPGRKLVAKKPTARWRDENEVKALCESLDFATDETHKPAELKSPAQLREVFAPTMPGRTKKARLAAAKAALDELTSYVSGGHTLVPESDPREPIRPSAADDFDAI